MAGGSADFIFMGARIFLKYDCLGLRCPAVIHFISRDACSDSISKLFRVRFLGYHSIIAQYVAKKGRRAAVSV